MKIASGEADKVETRVAGPGDREEVPALGADFVVQAGAGASRTRR
jgi:hypothetical protein